MTQDTAREALIERQRIENENQAFHMWWIDSGHANEPSYSLTVQNACHAAWQARAALRTPEPVAVGVKALKWTVPHPSIKFPSYAAQNSSLLIRYAIRTDGSLSQGRFSLHADIGLGSGWVSGHDDLETAKAAAQADYERRIRSALTTPPKPVVTEAMVSWAGPVPAFECPFHIGQAVKIAAPQDGDNPDDVFFVTGINWEHRPVLARGWNITIASREDIEKGYGQTDGYGPDDLAAALAVKP